MKAELNNKISNRTVDLTGIPFQAFRHYIKNGWSLFLRVFIKKFLKLNKSIR